MYTKAYMLWPNHLQRQLGRSSRISFIQSRILRQIYERRDPWAHKGRYGRLALICGSERHTGSACFAGMSAYRAGADLVYVIAPERAADVAADFSPVLMTTPLPGPSLTRKHENKILATLREVKATAAVVGPGLWREKETLRAITRLVSRIRLPMVLDADAIRAIGALRRKPVLQRSVYTPHPGEFKDLTGATVTPDIEKRSSIVSREAAKLSAVILLKGHIDVISNGDVTFLNKTGSPFMTKGGLGDTLTGICGAYLARGTDPLTSACAAAYVNGRAGSLASMKLGESLLPTDLINHIQDAIRPSTPM